MSAQAICIHHAEGEEMLERSDELLPGYVVRLECPTCGAAAEWDTELSEVA